MLKSNAASAAVGGTGLAYPLWAGWITGYQTLIAIGGAVVIALTIYNKVLEIRQRRRDLHGK